MRTAAFRRYKEDLKKQKVKQYIKRWYTVHPPSARDIGKHAHTPAICSCDSCGNPRKFYGNSEQGYKISELRKIKYSD